MQLSGTQETLPQQIVSAAFVCTRNFLFHLCERVEWHNNSNKKINRNRSTEAPTMQEMNTHFGWAQKKKTNRLSLLFLFIRLSNCAVFMRIFSLLPNECSKQTLNLFKSTRKKLPHYCYRRALSIFLWVPLLRWALFSTLLMLLLLDFYFCFLSRSSLPARYLMTTSLFHSQFDIIICICLFTSLHSLQQQAHYCLSQFLCQYMNLNLSLLWTLRCD